jgi:hypothetical protein
MRTNLIRPHIASELIANGIQKLNRKWTKNSKKEVRMHKEYSC